MILNIFPIIPKTQVFKFLNTKVKQEKIYNSLAKNPNLKVFAKKKVKTNLMKIKKIYKNKIIKIFTNLLNQKYLI